MLGTSVSPRKRSPRISEMLFSDREATASNAFFATCPVPTVMVDPLNTSTRQTSPIQISLLRAGAAFGTPRVVCNDGYTHGSLHRWDLQAAAWPSSRVEGTDTWHATRCASCAVSRSRLVPFTAAARGGRAHRGGGGVDEGVGRVGGQGQHGGRRRRGRPRNEERRGNEERRCCAAERGKEGETRKKKAGGKGGREGCACERCAFERCIFVQCINI